MITTTTPQPGATLATKDPQTFSDDGQHIPQEWTRTPTALTVDRQSDTILVKLDQYTHRSSEATVWLELTPERANALAVALLRHITADEFTNIRRELVRNHQE